LLINCYFAEESEVKSLIVFMLFILKVSAASAQGYTVTTGPGALISPPYEGARQLTTRFLPWLNATPTGEVRRPTVPDDSLGITLPTELIGVAVVGALRGERNTNAERSGLRYVDSALELGLAFDYWPRDWVRARIEVKKGLSGHSGWIADLGLDAFTSVGPLTLVAGPRLGLGSSSYMDKYFGVTADEAAASPLVSTLFSPRAGMRYYGIATGVVHRHGNWQEVAGFTWHRLSGDAEKSPLVSQLGEANQIIITLGIMYTFNIGK
jgi:outer membrane protein